MLSAPPLPSAGRRSVVRFIVDHNPFFLLSAACMLLASRLLISELSQAQGRFGSSLVFLLTLNLYEGLLIALGAFLVRRPGCERDGFILLIIETFFLVDVTFVNFEIATAGGRGPALIAGLTLVLAAAKVWAILRGLNAARDNGLLAFIVMELALLVLMPSVFGKISRAHDGVLPMTTLHATWWLIGGALIPMSLMLSAHRSGLVRLMLSLPLVSLIAHLGLCYWVYKVPFGAANLSPVVLGFAVLTAWLPGGPRHVGLAALRLALLTMAVVLAHDPDLSLVQMPWHKLEMTAEMLTFGAAYLAFIYLFIRPATLAIAFLAIGIIATSLKLFGPTAAELTAMISSAIDHAVVLASRALSIGKRMMPKTQAQWGITAASGSFALLGLGAMFSLRRKPKVMDAAAVE